MNFLWLLFVNVVYAASLPRSSFNLSDTSSLILNLSTTKQTEGYVQSSLNMNYLLLLMLLIPAFLGRPMYLQWLRSQGCKNNVDTGSTIPPTTSSINVPDEE